jgi:hypothetical protein
MPMESKAQGRYMHWAAAHPKEAARRGMKPGVAEEFIAAQHGHSEAGLPERAPQRHAEGGRVELDPHGRVPFRW